MVWCASGSHSESLGEHQKPKRVCGADFRCGLRIAVLRLRGLICANPARFVG